MGLKRRQRVEPEFSLAAMIDVIFLLLMFFMLTSKFVTPNALNLSLPSSSSTTMASPSLAVSIDAQSNYYFEVDGRTNKVTKDRLQASLESKIKAMGKDPQSTTITIVAEKTVPINDVVFVLEIANRLKLKTILATDPDSAAPAKIIKTHVNGTSRNNRSKRKRKPLKSGYCEPDFPFGPAGDVVFL